MAAAAKELAAARGQATAASSSSIADASNTKKGTIDVWWLADDKGLLVLLPHLLMKHKLYRHQALRVFIVVPDSTQSKTRLAVRGAMCVGGGGGGFHGSRGVCMLEMTAVTLLLVVGPPPSVRPHHIPPFTPLLSPLPYTHILCPSTAPPPLPSPPPASTTTHDRRLKRILPPSASMPRCTSSRSQT